MNVNELIARLTKYEGSEEVISDYAGDNFSIKDVTWDGDNVVLVEQDIDIDVNEEANV